MPTVFIGVYIMCVKVTTEYANGGLDNDDKDFFKPVFLDDELTLKKEIAYSETLAQKTT